MYEEFYWGVVVGFCFFDEIELYFFECVDEFVVDDFVFFFGVGYIFEVVEEDVGGIDCDELYVGGFYVVFFDLFVFIFVEKVVVDEDCCELVVDGFVYESG